MDFGEGESELLPRNAKSLLAEHTEILNAARRPILRRGRWDPQSDRGPNAWATGKYPAHNP